MPWAGWLADGVLVVHALFVGFVVFGGLVVLRRRWVAWLHLPALAWGAFVIGTGRICPLTPWENTLRRAAGEAGYAGGFIEHYVAALIYPPGLTREVQVLLAVGVVVLNAGIYGRIWRRRRSGAA